MRVFVELTNGNKKVLLPLESFEVWAFEDGSVRIYNSHDDSISFECEESFDEVKALIAAAQDEPVIVPATESKKRFIPVTSTDGDKMLIDISRILGVRSYGENKTIISDVLGQLEDEFWLVKEPIEEVYRMIKEAQE